MLVRTVFSFSYSSDVKALPGFSKGGKLPKEFSSYSNELICGWSEKKIKEHIENIATKSKESLEISARNFKTPVYDSGIGSFECQFFNYDFSVVQSEEDSGKCTFTGILEVKDIETFNQVKSTIDHCFDFTFDKVVYSLPKVERDIKELIYSLDDNKKKLSEVFDFSYENDFSSFQLVHQISGRIITVDNSKIEVKFKASESISEMINALQDVNQQVSVAILQDFHLLNG